jgi:molybdopterin/thiamine biosynthesis adenylyltransferase
MTESQRQTERLPAPAAPAGAGWVYEDAFSRHLGLMTPEEQERLRTSRVAIVGMGGVGGIHLATLTRLGIGAFHIADPDRFELANFNRQYGATTHTLGRSKAEVMAEAALGINPELDVRVFPEAIAPDNVGRFLDGVDLLVDGVDGFALPARRLLFQEARRRGLWAVTAAPLGFSTAWLSFSPTGMAFDEYFDINDAMAPLDQLIAFAVGLAPRAMQRPYVDLSFVDPARHRAPSTGFACHLCSGVAAAEVLKLLLGREPVRPAPWYFQFDPYRQIFCKGYLRGGNRHPLQRLKRWLFRKQARRLGWTLEGEGVAAARRAAEPTAAHANHDH